MGNGKKLKTILHDKKISVAELSRMTGIAASTLHSTIRRDGDFNNDNLSKITKALNISPTKLIDYSNLEFRPREMTFEEMEEYAHRLKKVINMYLSLNFLGQQRAENYIKKIYNTPEYTTSIVYVEPILPVARMDDTDQSTKDDVVDLDH